MIRSIRSKALKRFWQSQDATGLRPDSVTRVRIVMSAFDAARKPDEMDVPGLRFHALKGDMAGRYAVSVSGSWRITFGWSGEDAVAVDLEDCHGK